MIHCLHCKWRKSANGCRGLCGACHRRRDVREQYPSRRPYDPAAGPRCLHCQDRKSQKHRRGLCQTCYDTPEIRQKHPPAFIVGGISANTNRPALTPTDFLPGSEGKIAVMCARAKSGTALWHPEDCYE